MKKGFFIVLSVFGIAALITLISIDFDEYTLENNLSEIEPEFKRWLQQGDTRSLNPSIKDFFQIDDTNTYIALFQLEDGDIGYAKLLKGWNGKLKIEHASYGTNVISYRPIETNKGLYGIFTGINPEGKIDYIQKYYMNDFNFIVKIPSDEIFTTYHEIPEEARDGDDWSDFVLYDENNNTVELKEIYDLVNKQKRELQTK